ncbi:MAG: YigZ family protein [Clostridia bacterium]|nr:YigZ family protein [Clostridia bacterium]
MAAYFSVSGEATSERVIEKSRFITYCKHVENEEEAKAFLGELHTEHPLATHICYAYICDKIGNFARFSDDGEPQGTAGMPILGVIKAKKLFETLVAVVRYFGGIKLGAGGLTRAYASCAAEGVNGAEVVLFDICTEIAVGVSYSDVKALTRFAEGRTVTNREYDEKTVFCFRVRESEEEAFIAAVQNEFRGRAEIHKKEKGYYPCD